MRAYLTTLCALALLPSALADQLLVRFAEPPTGGCVAVGSVDFPMGDLKSVETLRIVAGQDYVEVPVAILATSAWPDGSILSADIAFPVADASLSYGVEWGVVRRQKHFDYKPSKDTKPVSFTAVELESSLDVTVGQLMVRVDKRAALYNHWYWIPIAAILGLLVYRKARLR
ncbi:MAG: hypothetical protein FJ272_21350 [Planctomycetes bacterium]|nr:hypothetical protein [Planctomycetota bacterium]